MSDLPFTFKRQDLRDALELLGIPLADLCRVTIHPNRISVEQLRRSESGLPIVAGIDISTVTTVIGLERE